MANHHSSKLVRVLRGGKMTIPVEFRRKLGITEQTMLRVTLDGNGRRVAPADAEVAKTGSWWLRELYELYAPVRADILDQGRSEEEVNADIDAAIKAYRAEQRHKNAS